MACLGPLRPCPASRPLWTWLLAGLCPRFPPRSLRVAQSLYGPRVLKDWACATTEALEDKDEKEVEVAKSEWRKLVETYWQNVGDDGPKQPKRKLHRKASHTWLLAVDRQMQVTLGVGLKHYILPPLEERGPPASWPLLMVASDEGSGGICAMNYLTYNLGCGLVKFRDISHRTWNNCCDAMRDAGVWNFFFLAGRPCRWTEVIGATRDGFSLGARQSRNTCEWLISIARYSTSSWASSPSRLARMRPWATRSAPWSCSVPFARVGMRSCRRWRRAVGSRWSTSLTLPIAVNHPFVVAQNELTKRLGALIERLLNHFLRGFAWHVDGWPGGFAAMLHPDGRYGGTSPSAQSVLCR